eukprot:TRINITY_DN2022_c0_g1_i14.p1 TRINITY_DN2022_c0_g1~~TRINITY_DN2022_c0_g1_i14.p1  ORF type:complete len:144 (-),score=15.25 TRINITY_DN2022_c0_g1_i14:109-540(-)
MSKVYGLRKQEHTQHAPPLKSACDCRKAGLRNGRTRKIPLIRYECAWELQPMNEKKEEKKMCIYNAPIRALGAYNTIQKDNNNNNNTQKEHTHTLKTHTHIHTHTHTHKHTHTHITEIGNNQITASSVQGLSFKKYNPNQILT